MEEWPTGLWPIIKRRSRVNKHVVCFIFRAVKERLLNRGGHEKGGQQRATREAAFVCALMMEEWPTGLRSIIERPSLVEKRAVCAGRQNEGNTEA